MRPIQDVAAELGVSSDLLVPHGAFQAKLDLSALDGPPRGAGRLVLVSAMTPSRLGEGKTTVSIGLSMGLRALGRRAVVCLREPSLGPVFGKKGGGTGGGRSQVVPADSINLHFTGDMHAIGSAHNLLSALIANSLQHETCDLERNRVTWRRVLDVNDRALRSVIVGLGGRSGGAIRETGFDITAASEVMAVLCLSSSLSDMEARLGQIVVGRTRKQVFVEASELEAAGAMTVLLKDALLPNLVQTLEGGPALVHGGAFADLAHGCSSLLATRLGMRYADDVVTEAGFGFDLGGEKFLQIKCRTGGIWPRCVVLTATLRGLKVQGGISNEDALGPNLAAVSRGLPNLDHHLASVAAFGLPAVVALNVFAEDPADELELVEAHCQSAGVPIARCEAFTRGGQGALELAGAVAEVLDSDIVPTPRFLYDLEAPYVDKLRAVARTLYGADDVHLDTLASRSLERFVKAGYAHLPVCVAKTPHSLSDTPSRLGRPSGLTVSVREARLSAGAGLVVALMGTISTMPGLPKQPNARRIRLEGGQARGLMQGD